MIKNKVIIVSCQSYAKDEVAPAMKKIFDFFGGVNNLFEKMSKVAVKVNFLMPAPPEKAVTTHPMIAFTAASELINNNVNPFVIDSPAGNIPYTEESMRNLYCTTGYADLFKDSNIGFNYDTTFKNINFPQAKVIKYHDIISPILSADSVLNIAKAKTHGFTYVTGATKNLFGIIPGLYKAGCHLKLKNIMHFSDMLVDIADFVKPKLSIIDAVIGMEGNGPSDGTPRKIGYIIASDSPFAADYIFCKIINLDYKKNPVLVRAEERGLFNKDNLIIEGTFNVIKDYKFPDTAVTIDGFVNPSLPFKLLKGVLKDLTVKPMMNKNCTRCGKCKKICPSGAITMGKSKAIIDYDKCIRCYCCHEVCTSNAVDFHKTLRHKILERLVKNRG
ncbi:DUF362 domain-containing protein [Candidatus Poribacteria bacterium]|nr:DUF362 domain-containing protein [Candidatus Poribacteria bacterium]